MPVREINIGSRGLQSNSNRSQQIGSGRFRWIGSFRQAESLTFSDQSSRQSRFAENRRSAPRGLCDMGEGRVVKNGCEDFEKSKMTNLI